MATKWEVIESDTRPQGLGDDVIKTFDTLEEALEFGQRWDDLNKSIGLLDMQVIVSEVEAES